MYDTICQDRQRKQHRLCSFVTDWQDMSVVAYKHASLFASNKANAVPKPILLEQIFQVKNWWGSHLNSTFPSLCSLLHRVCIMHIRNTQAQHVHTCTLQMTPWLVFVKVYCALQLEFGRAWVYTVNAPFLNMILINGVNCAHALSFLISYGRLTTLISIQDSRCSPHLCFHVGFERTATGDNAIGQHKNQ